jgi:small subunit ribosomal protein S1
VLVRVVQPQAKDEYVLVSLHDALEEGDWQRAEALLAGGEAWRGRVASYNRGGLLVHFGRLKVFVPASHLGPQSRHKRSPAQRDRFLAGYVGRELPLQFIELSREKRRLVASERLGRDQERQDSLDRLLGELREGDIIEGRVCHLCDFGAFVDLGGADGLIHISELDWGKVRHPRDVVELGERLEVYVLNLDPERERIGLSLKRLRPSPWEMAEKTLRVDELASGVVTNVVDFGAFVAMDDVAIEGLLHISELSDPPPADPRTVVRRGDRLVVRVLQVDPLRRRMRLSLLSVADWERDAWLSRREGGPPPDRR